MTQKKLKSFFSVSLKKRSEKLTYPNGLQITAWQSQ